MRLNLAFCTTLTTNPLDSVPESLDLKPERGPAVASKCAAMGAR
jgi:hypothetical protein